MITFRTLRLRYRIESLRCVPYFTVYSCTNSASRDTSNEILSRVEYARYRVSPIVC